MEKLPEDLEKAFADWDDTEDNLRWVRAAYQEAAANRDRQDIVFQSFKLGGAAAENMQAMRKAMELTIDWVSKGVTNADN